MQIAIGADHAGFSIKQQLVTYVKDQGHEVLDLGTHGPDAVHYPDYTEALALAVLNGPGESESAGNPFQGIEQPISSLRCRRSVGETEANDVAFDVDDRMRRRAFLSIPSALNRPRTAEKRQGVLSAQ